MPAIENFVSYILISISVKDAFDSETFGRIFGAMQTLRSRYGETGSRALSQA